MRCLCSLCFAIVLSFSTDCFAQDVVSRTSGFWDDPLTWEGGTVPTALTADQITILSGHDVLVRDIRVADQIVVDVGGSLTISSSGTFQLQDGPGTDLIILGRTDVHGIVDGNDGSTISSSETTLSFHEGSSYFHRHSTTEGSLPLAWWHREASVVIAGYTSVPIASVAGNWSQDFGTMIWNTPNLQAPFNLSGQLNHLKGNLIVQSTGPHRLLLSSAGGPDALYIDGAVQLNGSASMELTNSSLGVFTLIVGEDLLINTTGILSLANVGRGIIDLRSDFSIIAGTVNESGTGTGEFLFANSTRHQFNRGVSGLNGVFNGRINYTISATDTLDLGIAVLSPGVGTNNANVLSVNGTLMVGSIDAAGAIQNNTTAGNIRTTVSQRVFSPGSRVIYSGLQPQVFGNSGIAAGANTETVIDNLFGVSLGTNITIGGPLQLKSGSLHIGTRTLTLSGNVTRSNGRIESTPTSTLVIADSIAGNRDVNLSPDQLVLATFSVDRRSIGASLVVSSDILTNQLNLFAGSVSSNNRLTLTENGMLSRWSRASLDGEGIAVVNDAQYDVTYRTNSTSAGPFAKIHTGTELPNDFDKLRNLVIATGQSLDTVVLTKDITINNLLDMNRGRFYVQHHTINFKGTVWSDDTGNFGQGTGTVVFTDSTSVQGSSNPVFNSVQALPGSKVRFARNISVSGNVDFLSGSIVEASSITMTLTGPASQQINTNGVTVGNITVSKSNQSFVQLQSALSLRGILRFNTPSANIDFRSNGFLTLLSAVDTATTSFGNSMIYRLQNGNAVSGDVTVQRFMSGEGRIYRYLSSPVTNATIAEWKDDFSITGNFPDPSPAEIICGSAINRSSSSLFYYDEVKGSTTQSGYIAYPLPGVTSLSSPLQPGRGYAAFIRQCSAPTVVDVTGPINQSLVNLPVTYTSGSSMSGWNLVGNPYPCTIDWDLGGAQGWIKTNIAPSIAIRDNGGGGFYRYWDGDGDPADLVEGRIAPGQGFWVRAIAPNPVLALREGVKVLQTATYYRDRDTTSVIVISLHHGNQVDKAYVKTRDGASNGLDSLDCPKLDNVAYDLSTYSSDEVTLAINALENLPCEGEMRLICKDLEPGNYRFQLQVKGTFQNYIFSFRDNLTGKESDPAEAFSFDLSSTLSFDDRRFTLRWGPRPHQPVTFSTTTYSLCESDSIEVKLLNAEDVRYELWEDTVRVSETLMVRARDITPGVHKLRVHAVSSCRHEPVGDTIVVIRSNPLLKSWKGGQICNEGTALLCAQAEGNAIVHWYSSLEDEVPVAVDTVFETSIINQSKDYFASAVAAGCESRRHKVTARVISFAHVSIARQGNLLISSMETGNEWSFNGIELEGENGSVIYIEESGVYSVQNHVESCVTQASVELTGSAPSLANIYPNPVESLLMMEADFDDLVRVELLNTLGQPVAEIDAQAIGTKKIGIFDATKLKAGLYFLRLVTVGRKEEILMVVKK